QTGDEARSSDPDHATHHRRRADCTAPDGPPVSAPWSHIMRSVILRLTALAGAVALVASCDSRLPTATSVIGSTPTSTTTSPNVGKPTVVIDSPLVGTLINLGDSVLVSVRL